MNDAETLPETLFTRAAIEAGVVPDSVSRRALQSGGYPYPARMPRKPYMRTLEALQIELLKLQRHVAREKIKLVIVFEGRDAAGKGGTIKRVTQHLNPRQARVVALTKPNDRERGQWYFQRYVDHLPTGGEIVLLDRSWYNRAGVEPVMGFCTPQESAQFLEEVPRFEEMLVRDGTRLVKFWLEVGREMQLTRLHDRHADPLKQWKLSEMDLEGVARWHDYTAMRDRMFQASDRALTPWTIVRANDKRRLRLNVIRHVLDRLDYADKRRDAVTQTDPDIGLTPEAYFSTDM